MPIFEFKCMDCNEYVELLVMNKKDEVELVCPKCGSENLERILSTTNHTVTGGSHGRPADSGASAHRPAPAVPDPVQPIPFPDRHKITEFADSNDVRIPGKGIPNVKTVSHSPLHPASIFRAY
jgi:putative FmdB family regulatory protein